MSELAETARRSLSWLQDLALPLWAELGFDATSNAFEEQLTFDGEPVRAAPRRVMVQARQIATFAAAALAGQSKTGADLALSAGRAMLTRYFEADGAPGFVFAIDRDGRIVDTRRDLYAHAFILFSLAWLLRLDRDPIFVRAVDAALDAIDRLFADPLNGGYFDGAPRADKLRRQNSHMHLFEALLALFETTQRADLIERARLLRNLAAVRFIDSKTGVLSEYFDETWNVSPKPGRGSVEPGHLFEWAWLLRRFEAATGEDQTLLVSALLAMAMTCGLDHVSGRIVDEISEGGALRRASSRLWPHAEALKALTTEALRGSPSYVETIVPILTRLSTVFCPAGLNGGWIDHFDERDRPLSRVMPASSLYHIYFGIVEVANANKPGAQSCFALKP